MIHIQGICKSYGDKIAVDHIDLHIAEGSLLGLVGPNGAGKTTTLKMLATMIKPDAGQISIGDYDLVYDIRDIRRMIGYMPDSFGTFRGLMRSVPRILRPLLRTERR